MITRRGGCSGVHGSESLAATCGHAFFGGGRGRRQGRVEVGQ